jgi:hypothetical protein
MRLEREQDGRCRAAGQVELLLPGQALEGVEDVAATILEAWGTSVPRGESIMGLHRATYYRATCSQSLRPGPCHRT